MDHTPTSRFTTIRLREGYDKEQVDTFLTEVEAEMAAGRANPALAQRIREVLFMPVRIRMGYDMGEVDHYLEALVVEVESDGPAS